MIHFFAKMKTFLEKKQKNTHAKRGKTLARTTISHVEPGGAWFGIHECPGRPRPHGMSSKSVALLYL